MKKILLLVTLAFNLNTIAQVPSHVPLNGLIGYWPFSGNANDYSINANNGIVNGAILTTDRFGNLNSAYNFNGTSSFISIPKTLFLNPPFTLTAWVKIPQYPTVFGELPILGIGDLGTNLLNQLYFSPAYGPTGKPSIGSAGNSDISSNQEISLLNQWFFIAVTCNSWSTDDTKFYVNKTPNSSNRIFGNPFPLNDAGSSIGKQGNDYFSGEIDDIGIWNRVLTTTELNDLFTNSSIITGINSDTYQNSINVWPNPSYGHITIENTNITNVTDYQMRITNSFGQQVFQSEITQQQLQLDMSTWTGKGMYFINIINKQSKIVHSKKVVLQ